MSKQILEGVKVLDLSAVVAGPMSAAFLSDFGADVIKVEPPKGDGMRKNGSIYNRVINRNKRCITLDFHMESAQKQFYRLVEWADVVITNFRPQAVKRFKIDYEDLLPYNPNIIYLHFTAYGRTGPYASKPGFARVVEAYTGLPYITGWPDRPPSMSGSWIADGIGGIYCAFMVAMALLHRERTGEGQMIDLGLYEPLFKILDNMPPDYSLTGKIPVRQGNMHQTMVPNNVYETKDGHFMAMPVNFNMFERLCNAMGRPELMEDERCATVKGRRANREYVDGLVADWVASKTRAEVMELSEKFEFACGPINSIKDVFEDPHMWERGSLVKIHDDKIDKDVVINGICGIFSKTPGEFKFLARDLGEDNEEVYKGILKLSDEEFQALKDEGAI